MVSGALKRLRTLETWGTSSRYDALGPTSQDEFLTAWDRARVTVRDARLVDRVILPAHGAIATARVKPRLNVGDLFGMVAGFVPVVGTAFDVIEVASCISQNISGAASVQ